MHEMNANTLQGILNEIRELRARAVRRVSVLAAAKQGSV